MRDFLTPWSLWLDLTSAIKTIDSVNIDLTGISELWVDIDFTKLIWLFVLLDLNLSHSKILFWDNLIYWISHTDFVWSISKLDNKIIRKIIKFISSQVIRHYKDNSIVLPKHLNDKTSSNIAKFILDKHKYKYSFNLILSLWFFNVNQAIVTLFQYMIDWFIGTMNGMLLDTKSKTDNVEKVFNWLPDWLLSTLSKFWLKSNLWDFHKSFSEFRSTIDSMNRLLDNISDWIHIYYVWTNAILIVYILFQIMLLKWMNNIGKIRCWPI